MNCDLSQNILRIYKVLAYIPFTASNAKLETFNEILKISKGIV